MNYTVRDSALVAMYQDGASLRQCGEKFGISLVAARKVLIKQGIDRRPTGRTPKHERNALVIETYDSGHTCAETGRIFGISPKRVHDILIYHGVARRPARRR